MGKRADPASGLSEIFFWEHALHSSNEQYNCAPGQCADFSQGAVDNEKATDVTADGLLLIVKQATVWRRIVQACGGKHSVQEALTDVYLQVLGFLMPAIHRLQKGRLGKWLIYPNALLGRLMTARVPWCPTHFPRRLRRSFIL